MATLLDLTSLPLFPDNDKDRNCYDGNILSTAALASAGNGPWMHLPFGYRACDGQLGAPHSEAPWGPNLSLDPLDLHKGGTDGPLSSDQMQFLPSEEPAHQPSFMDASDWQHPTGSLFSQPGLLGDGQLSADLAGTQSASTTYSPGAFPDLDDDNLLEAVEMDEPADPKKPPPAAAAKAQKTSESTTDDSQRSPSDPQPRRRGRKPVKRTAKEEQKRLQCQRNRNRLAAGRCRQKKKEETAVLADSARALERRRQSLQSTVDELKDEVLDLKEEVVQHRDCGCERVRHYIQGQYEQLVAQPAPSAPASTPSPAALSAASTPSPAVLSAFATPSPRISLREN